MLWVETECVSVGFDWAEPESGATDRPGVTTVRLRESVHWPTVQPVPVRGIWLWPEYYLRKGVQERSGISTAGLRHELRGDEVVYVYSPEPECQIEMEAGYRVHRNVIDARYTLTPHTPHAGFELFMASYVDSGFGETVVQARNIEAMDGWTVVDNRRHLWGVWMVLADNQAAAHFFDGR